MGGKAPITGFHSVIERPLSVNRVNPPMAIITATSAKITISQTRTAPRAPLGADAIIPPVAACTGPAEPTSSKILRLSAMRRPLICCPDPSARHAGLQG